MIRPLTLITMVLAACSGAYLFAVKHRAQVLDDQLAAIADQTRLDQQRIRVLQAQWSLEIDPTRLAQLAHQFTALQPMQPAQLTTLASLGDTLPPPGSAAPGANPAAALPVLPAAPDNAAPGAASAGNGPIAQATPTGLPLPPPAAPGAPVSPLRLASVPAHPPTLHPGHAGLGALVRTATREPPHRSRPPSQLAAATSPQPPPRSFHPVYPMGAQVMSVRASSGPAAFAGGSALAMGADLAPPQPLSAGGSAGGANN